MQNQRVEEKRAIFHRYLQQSGVIEALSRALIRLYDEPIKPDDPVAFVRQHMGAAGADDNNVAVNETADSSKVETAGDEVQLPGETEDVQLTEEETDQIDPVVVDDPTDQEA